MQFKTTPYAHQLEAFNISKDKKAFALFMDMGTGKSKVAIDTIYHLYMEGEINAAVICAPKGVYQTWYDSELPAHLPNHEKHSITLWRKRETKKQKSILSAGLNAPAEQLSILIINIEALNFKRAYEYLTWFLETFPDNICILDESATIKNPRAGRTKRMLRLKNLIKYRRILSGLPTPHSPLDIYTQYSFLDQKFLGYTSYYSFRNRYAVLQPSYFNGRRMEKVVGHCNTKELAKIMAPYLFRVRKKDCLDLPEKIYTKIAVPLTVQQTKAYNQMAEQSYIELVSQQEMKIAITAPTILARLGRLHTIVCGILRDEPKVYTLENNRIHVLLETIERMSYTKIIIWGTYKNNIETIVHALREKYGYESTVKFYGRTVSTDRAKAIALFQDSSSKCRFFVGTPSTSGMGITLSAAECVIYYSNDYNLQNRLQSEDRAHRIGQRNNVLYIDLETKGTVDEMINFVLRRKKNLSDVVINSSLKDIFKRYSN